MTGVQASPLRLGPAQHGIRSDRVDGHSIEVVARLQDAGYQAYLVGGCVRDMLLGIEPKDFDVATDATPEDVKNLFRRARLVGRRFRIAHVRFGRDIIEVSTFRRAESGGIELDASGMIVSDNQFGSLEEDAWRRDFTINALYYDPVSGELLDYVGALDDLRNRRIAFIGRTEVRLAEDPVRALRALRFKAKLRFDICSSISDALVDTARRLQAVSSARLFEEFNKLFLLGYAHAAWQAITESPLHDALFPATPQQSEIVSLAMCNTDERIAADKPTTPGFLIAVLLWEGYASRLAALSVRHPPMIAAEMAADQVIANQSVVIAIPRRFSQFAREVWSLQPRLLERHQKSIDRIHSHKRFRAAFDLFELRARVNPTLEGALEWWIRYQQEPSEREKLIADLPVSAPDRRPRKRRRRGSPAVEGLSPAS